MPWDEAVLVEPFTIGAQACYRGNVQKDDVVLVYGAGTIGLSVAQLAKLYGATVIVTDLVDAKLDYAKSRGADHVINAGLRDVAAEVRRITGGMGSNVTVDAVCNKKSLEDAVEITSAAGRVVNLSFNEVASEIVPKLVTQKELTLCGSRLQTKRFPVVIDFFVKGAIPVKGFVNKTFPLSDMLAAFKYVDDNGATTRKVVINME
jgi:L-gulonate 5-dehydrogenase